VQSQEEFYLTLNVSVTSKHAKQVDAVPKQVRQE